MRVFAAARVAGVCGLCAWLVCVACARGWCTLADSALWRRGTAACQALCGWRWRIRRRVALWGMRLADAPGRRDAVGSGGATVPCLLGVKVGRAPVWRRPGGVLKNASVSAARRWDGDWIGACRPW
eukprot:4672696-Prymnesium_polylepis.1